MSRDLIGATELTYAGTRNVDMWGWGTWGKRGGAKREFKKKIQPN